MNANMNDASAVGPARDRRQGKRLDEIAFALVLVMTGALWLAPKAMFPDGAWLVGAGLIVLGLNAARRIRGLKASSFGIIVGLAAFAAGIARIIGQELPFWPILLIVFGVGLIIRAVARHSRPADTPEAS